MSVKNKLAAYMLDKAVVLLGSTIDGALMERTEPNDDGKTHPIYTLDWLLLPGSYLPRRKREQASPMGLERVHGMMSDEVK